MAIRFGQTRTARNRNETGDNGTWLAGVWSRSLSNIDL
jgi:hypothetical protein